MPEMNVPVETIDASAVRSPRAVRQVLVLGLLASAAPLVMLLFNRDWLLTAEIFLDPWHYVGLFREYLNPDYSPRAYKLARLPWIIAGALVTSVLPALAAAYVLHAASLMTMTLALFAGLVQLLRLPALAGVVALLLGFYTHAHGSGGWDYHNAAAGPLYMLTFMVLAMPVTVAGRAAPIATAGALAGLAVHANITLVNFLPALAFVYVETIRARTGSYPGPADFVRRAGWGLLGVVVATAVLCAINWAVGRELLFFMVLANIVAQYVADPELVAGYRFGAYWFLTARHLALLVSVFAGGIVMLATRRRSAARIATALVAQFVALALVWLGWQLAGQLALDWNYFAYVLIPSCFIAIGGLLAGSWPERFESHPFATVLVTATFLAAGLQVNVMPEAVVRATAGMVMPVGAALFVAGLLAYMARCRIVASVAFVLLFAVANRLVAKEPLAQYGADDPCKLQPAIYEAVVGAATAIGRLDPSYTRVRTWFEQQEEIEPLPGCPVGVGAMGGAITTMSFVPYVVPPFPMPDVDALPDEAVLSLANNDLILVILTSRADPLERWDRRLVRLGLQRREVARHEVPLESSGFTIHAWTVTVVPTEGVTFGPPFMAVTASTPPQINVYGMPRGSVSAKGGETVFVPTDARDHLAYPMVDVPRKTGGGWARLTVDAKEGSPAGCRVWVQDQQLQLLTSAPCYSTTKYFKVPNGTTGIRIYLADPTGRAFTLPARVELALAAPP